MEDEEDVLDDELPEYVVRGVIGSSNAKQWASAAGWLRRIQYQIFFGVDPDQHLSQIGLIKTLLKVKKIDNNKRKEVLLVDAARGI